LIESESKVRIHVDVERERERKIQWSQRVNSGERERERENSWTNALNKTIFYFFKLCFYGIVLLKQKREREIEKDEREREKDGTENITLENFSKNLKIVTDILLEREREQNEEKERKINKYLSPITSSSNVKETEKSLSLPLPLPLSPDWIRSCALFRSSLATWAPLIGQHVLSLLPNESKRKKGKKKKGGGGGEGGESGVSVMLRGVRDMKTALQLLGKSMEEIEATLNNECINTNNNSINSKCIISYLTQYISENEIEKELDIIQEREKEKDEVMITARNEVIRKIVESHLSSCERLRDGLRDKLVLMKECLTA